MNQPIGVIFDMDGVLIDSAQPHLESWRQVAVESQCKVSEETFATLFGRRNEEIIPIVFGEVTETRMQEIAMRKEDVFRTLVQNQMPVIPGAVELIESLHERGIRVAVGSSAPRANIDLALLSIDTANRIDAVVSGEDVTRGKPDPQVFQTAAERLGLTPRQCVVVEDAPAGIQAGHAAGSRTVAVLIHHPASAFPQADYQVNQLADLTPDIICELLGV